MIFVVYDGHELLHSLLPCSLCGKK